MVEVRWRVIRAAGLAGAMAYVLAQPEVAAKMRVAGLRQAARFSWARTAAQTAAVYRTVLGGAP